MVNTRPQNEEELQKREALGVIRASRFVRRYVQSHESITVQTILDIHKEIFDQAWPEIAGQYRAVELYIADSDLLLPHHTDVPILMQKLDIELRTRLNTLTECEGHIYDLQNQITDQAIECIDKVLNTATWLHHAITAIHPFREGNGRTARLTANLILERYGLVGISVKIEKENKNEYRKALAQIDQYGDYEPLKNIISEGIMERYNGVVLKYYQG